MLLQQTFLCLSESNLCNSTFVHRNSHRRDCKCSNYYELPAIFTITVPTFLYRIPLRSYDCNIPVKSVILSRKSSWYCGTEIWFWILSMLAYLSANEAALVLSSHNVTFLSLPRITIWNCLRLRSILVWGMKSFRSLDN